MALIKKDDNSSIISSSSISSQSTAGKKRKQIVLEEDEFIEVLDKIIERDFFPSLSKMKNQLKLFDNPTYNLQMSGDSSGLLSQTPSTFETPIGISTSADVIYEEESVDQEANQESGKDKIRTNLSLNAFLARYTSEDNASFEVIMKEAERRHKEKYPWLYLEENKMVQSNNADGKTMIEGNNLQAQISWPYKNINALMFIPEEDKDVEQIHSNKYTTICYENTRFKRNPFNDHLSETVLAEAAACNLKDKSGKIGIDGKELTDDVLNIGGYSLVPLTPSPAPGVNTTPLMTWGQIEGTPYSLDGGSTPVMSSSLLPSNTPQFKIPDVPEREKIGHALADKMTRNNRDKKKEALKQAQYLRNSPLICSGSKTFSESLGSMSPAAQKLATLRLGINKNVDKELRGSYSPALSRTPDGRLRSPITPVSSTLYKATTPKVSSSSSLTDGLLKIPRKTQKS